MRRLAIVACLWATAAAVAYAHPGADLGAGHVARGPVRIHGRVGGLYPGARKRMAVTLVNRANRVLVVSGLRARARRAGPGCPGRELVVVPRRRVGVLPHRRARVRLAVRLRSGAPDACQGRTFRLRFRGKLRFRGGHRFNVEHRFKASARP